ncbi:hypothetical protein M427DRAFT_26896 [Gonapodya prolifera JEL478]|uniref:Mediator complex subunit 17 n=1 Tax=Gonapodya prolifera (strain JEL478) TaxID=1344416 RepID=A0A139B034_GONPJ|nr:hypothetical protein M427DRAFT_26896 [Gonapodya prolifera JEL478]|eukprot:KXS22300.1 hypothetical protein M427DRAFT_26896 [Gonapodya prolifera JEL478]
MSLSLSFDSFVTPADPPPYDYLPEGTVRVPQRVPSLAESLAFTLDQIRFIDAQNRQRQAASASKEDQPESEADKSSSASQDSEKKPEPLKEPPWLVWSRNMMMARAEVDIARTLLATALGSGTDARHRQMLQARPQLDLAFAPEAHLSESDVTPQANAAHRNLVSTITYLSSSASRLRDLSNAHHAFYNTVALDLRKHGFPLQKKRRVTAPFGPLVDSLYVEYSYRNAGSILGPPGEASFHRAPDHLSPAPPSSSSSSTSPGAPVLSAGNLLVLGPPRAPIRLHVLPAPFSSAARRYPVQEAPVRLKGHLDSVDRERTDVWKAEPSGWDEAVGTLQSESVRPIVTAQRGLFTEEILALATSEVRDKTDAMYANAVLAKDQVVVSSSTVTLQMRRDGGEGTESSGVPFEDACEELEGARRSVLGEIVLGGELLDAYNNDIPEEQTQGRQVGRSRGAPNLLSSVTSSFAFLDFCAGVRDMAREICDGFIRGRVPCEWRWTWVDAQRAGSGERQGELSVRLDGGKPLMFTVSAPNRLVFHKAGGAEGGTGTQLHLSSPDSDFRAILLEETSRVCFRMCMAIGKQLEVGEWHYNDLTGQLVGKAGGKAM